MVAAALALPLLRNAFSSGTPASSAQSLPQEQKDSFVWSTAESAFPYVAMGVGILGVGAGGYYAMKAIPPALAAGMKDALQNGAAFLGEHASNAWEALKSGAGTAAKYLLAFGGLIVQSASAIKQMSVNAYHNVKNMAGNLLSRSASVTSSGANAGSSVSAATSGVSAAERQVIVNRANASMARLQESMRKAQEVLKDANQGPNFSLEPTIREMRPVLPGEIPGLNMK